MSKWLSIIGMGEDGYDGLSALARQNLNEAEVIIGSTRLLSLLPPLAAELQDWPQPFSKMLDRIEPLRGRRTVMLATGDPLNYGVARKVLEIVPFGETTIIPYLSAFSLAASRLGWSLPDCDSLTLHGRAPATIEPFIQPGARLIILTSDETTLPAVQDRLKRRGFGGSLITLLENLGGPRERQRSFRADDPLPQDISPLNTLGLQCVAGAEALCLARLPGLPDDAFVHDGQITKREVRAVTLAALAPAPDQLLWDVGAGAGSISIEWMRGARGAQAVAMEAEARRAALIARNADALGTPRLTIITGQAPLVFENQPSPDAIFIGGGLNETGVFEKAWERLKPRGRMVVNTVTLEGERRLYDLQSSHGGELLRLEISQLHQIGKTRSLKPRLPVTQWRSTKP